MRHSSKPETILVVDDDPIPLDICSAVLQRAGYCVLEASSGEKALSLFQPGCRPIDLALVDIVMPVMNGVEFVKQVEMESPATRIVLMSGYSSDEVERLVGDEASNYRCIWKPFEPVTLLRMIRNVLDMAKQPTVARQGHG